MIEIKIHTTEEIFRERVPTHELASARILNIRDNGGYFAEDVDGQKLTLVPMAHVSLIESYPIPEVKETPRGKKQQKQRSSPR